MKIFTLILSLIFVSSSFGQNLNKVDHKNKPLEKEADSLNRGLTAEETKELLNKVEVIKQRQEESKKMLEELDKDE